MVERILNRSLFHINRPNVFGALSVGQRVECGRIFNPFFQSLATQFQPLQQPDGTTRKVPPIAYLKNLPRGRTYSSDYVAAVTAFASNFQLYARELLWELVRVQEFSDAPSRLKCLWFTETLEHAHEWTDLSEEVQIVEVHATGVAHTAESGWLPIDSMPLEEQFARARAYWRGDRTGESFVEVVFCGDAVVKAIHA